MKNTVRFVSEYPIVSSLAYWVGALIGYALLTLLLSWINGTRYRWAVAIVLVVYLLLTLLAQSTPLIISVAAAFKTNKALGQRVAKSGYLIVLTFLATYTIFGYLTMQSFLLISKTFGIK